MNKILTILILMVAGIGILGFAGYMIWLNGFTKPSTSNTPPISSGGTPIDSGTTPVQQPGSQTPSTPNTPSLSGDTMTISNDNEGGIVVKNIKKDPQLKADPANPGYYYLGNPPTSDSPYIIIYIESTQYFNIVLNQEPIGEVREQMQKYLAERLGIPAADLCYLNYMVTVPYSVNQDFSSVDLRFSVCSDAVTF